MTRIQRMQQSLSEDKRPARLFERMLKMGAEPCRELATRYVSLLRFLAPGANRVADKMPHNFMWLGFIATLFPNARIVHCIRNPADNFISAFQNSMDASHSYSFTMENYALYYKEYFRLMRHWQELFEGRIFNLRYEEITAKPEKKSGSSWIFSDCPGIHAVCSSMSGSHGEDYQQATGAPTHSPRFGSTLAQLRIATAAASGNIEG